MRRWGMVTVLLYVIALVVLTVPLLLACFSWGKPGQQMNLHESIEVFEMWGYWLWIALSAAGQILLLAVPIAVAEDRPRARRHLLTPILTSTFLLSFLVLSGIGSILVALWKDDGLAPWAILGDDHLWRFIASFFLYVIVVWIVWAFVFHRFAKQSDPDSLNRRMMKWLLRGSILELLVAVPSHVIVRNRDDCCAPLMTFWGIAAGLTVMLISFGPGVFFLFVERIRRLKPRRAESHAGMGTEGSS